MARSAVAVAKAGKTSHKTAEKAKARILVVDDHPVVRQGLAQLLNAEPDLVVCGDAGAVPDAVKPAGELAPDLAIVDLSLKDGSGLELIKDLQVRLPDLPILVLSMLDETFYAERCLRAGARGYVMKEEPPERLLDAVRRVLRGEIYLTERMATRVLRKFAEGQPDGAQNPVDLLSDRELQVFGSVGKGLKTGQIALQLHLSVKTVESYREHIKTKLRLANAAELLQYAIQWVKSQPPS